MTSKSTLKTAAQLLDRFFRDAEGRTNRQIDVYFALEDMEVPREKSGPALDFLKSRGLLNVFGNDIAFLTDKGVSAVVDETDLGSLAKEVRDFVQKPVAKAPTEDRPSEGPSPGQKSGGSPRPPRAQLTHIDLEGGEFTLPLGHRCRIGRADDNEVRINDKRASKHHAELVYKDRAYYLVDLESANGTLLNGDYALEPMLLKHDDEIVIGRTMLLYQAPKVIVAPPDEPVKAPEPPEPQTVIARAKTPVPTERPARAASAPQVSGIRVVKGRPDAPPSSDGHRLPSVPSADLFAEPPTNAPKGDLFAPSTQARGSSAPEGDLFGDEPPTQLPGGGDLFGDGPADSRQAKAEGDLFADDAGDRREEGLFDSGSPSTGGDDLFSDPSAPPAATPPPRLRSATPLPDLDDGLELEPLAGAPELTQPPSGQYVVPAPTPAAPLDTPDTVADPDQRDPSMPPPSVDDLWTDEDTPTSEPPDPTSDPLLQNPPVQLDGTATIDTPGGDGATLMMDRSDLIPEAEVVPVDEHPHWSQTASPEGTHPAYVDPSAGLDAHTEALDAEDLPEASPSMALPAVNRDPATAATMDAAPADPTFQKTLAALKAHAKRADLPDGEAIVKAIELLEDHPYVRLALRQINS